MGARRRRYREADLRYRCYPLPWYDAADLIWHYHVICRTCLPKGAEDHFLRAIPTMAEAQATKRAFNDLVYRLGTHHRYTVEGCADTLCPGARPYGGTS